MWADRIWPILPLFFVAFASSPQAMAGGNVQVEGWPGGRVTPHFFWRNEMKFHGKSPKSGDFWLRKKKIRVSWNADWDSKILILILGWNVYSISSWWVQIFMFTPIWGRFPFWLLFFKWVEKPPTRYFWILLILWGGAWKVAMTWKCSQFESVRVRTWVPTIWTLVSWMPKEWSCRTEKNLHAKYQYKYTCLYIYMINFDVACINLCCIYLIIYE